MLLAAALGAGGAVGLLVVAVPGALASVVGEGPAAARSAGPPPASEVVVPGTVVAGSSCVAAGAQDVVAVVLDGVRHEMPLDGCGGIVGSSTTVRLLAAPDPSGHRVPHGAARVLGTGGDAPLDDPADPGRSTSTSPMAARITVTLTALAGLAMAGLLVTIGREGLRSRAAGTASAGRAAATAPAAPRTDSTGRRPAAASRPTATGSPPRMPAPRTSPPRTSPPLDTTGADTTGPDTPGAAGPADATGPADPGAGDTGPDAPAADDTASGTSGAPDRPRSRARSLRAPHPARSGRGEGRLGPGAERARRGPTDRSRPRRPR